jgi:hypothetical protein
MSYDDDDDDDDWSTVRLSAPTLAPMSTPLQVDEEGPWYTVVRIVVTVVFVLMLVSMVFFVCKLLRRERHIGMDRDAIRRDARAQLLAQLEAVHQHQARVDEQERTEYILRILPLKEYMYADGDSQEEVCAICLDGYEPGEILAASTSGRCVHQFHRDCVAGWLIGNVCCPVCRETFLEEDLACKLEKGETERTSVAPEDTRVETSQEEEEETNEVQQDTSLPPGAESPAVEENEQVPNEETSWRAAFYDKFFGQ